jgi:hypothetical protein
LAIKIHSCEPAETEIRKVVRAQYDVAASFALPGGGVPCFVIIIIIFFTVL